MNRLKLRLISRGKTRPLSFKVRRVVNAGYTGRDQRAVKAHIRELEKEGVAPPPRVPMFFPISARNVVTGDSIEVLSRKTSGEAECAILMTGKKIYLGVGSDHTDRGLEAASIFHSKEVCPNVMSREVWNYDEVADHWDSLVIKSWVRKQPRAKPLLYQNSPLTSILPLSEIIARVSSRLRVRAKNGLVIFSGTVPLTVPKTVYGSFFSCELFDPVLRRRLRCGYRVQALDYLKN